MPKQILALDIGGTTVSAGIVSTDGRLHSLPDVQIDSSDKAIATDVIELLAGIIRNVDTDFSGIGICLPGPFDYNAGVSLMTHKFPALKGANLGTALRKAISDIKEMEIKFCHDANAFLVGEMWQGAAVNVKRVMGITLGTGIGVSCCIDGKLLLNKLGAPAASVSVWSRKFKGGTVEDFISAKALISKYKKRVPEYSGVDGVKGIATSAHYGNIHATEVFNEYGFELGQILTESLLKYQPETVVFGGRISKCFPLFENAIIDSLEKNNANICQLCKSSLGETAALYGAASLFI